MANDHGGSAREESRTGKDGLLEVAVCGGLDTVDGRGLGSVFAFGRRWWGSWR